MEDAWNGDRHLAKYSINSMIGLFSIIEDHIYIHKSHISEEDLTMISNNNECLKIHTPYGEDQFVCDYIFRTKLVNGGATLRPLHDICLHTEATRMAQISDMIVKLGCPMKSIFQYKTDSILFDPPKRKACQINSVINQCTFTDLNNIHNKNRINMFSNLTEHNSTERVYRIKPTRDKNDFLNCETKLPITNYKYTYDNFTWTHVDAFETIKQNKSIFLTGAPGTGKSYLVKQIIQHLRDNNKTVLVTSKTHVAAQGIEGDTLNHIQHKFLKRGNTSFDWIVIDYLYRNTIAPKEKYP